MNRDTPKAWMDKGGRSYGERVVQKALEILETHQPEPLPEDVHERLDAIARKAEKALADMQFVA